MGRVAPGLIPSYKCQEIITTRLASTNRKIMSTIFNDREKGFETKFKMDQETEFKVEARRNKLLGLWLAEKLGLPNSEYDAYSKAVVLADLAEPGVEDIMRKVMKDIEEKGVDVTDSDVRQKLEELYSTAYQETTRE